MNRLAVPALAAVAGAVTLAYLFPRFDPSGSLHLTLDRKTAIQRAQTLSSTFGVNTAGWSASVVSELPDSAAKYAFLHPDDPVLKQFGKIRITVSLTAPAGKRSLRAGFYEDGRPFEWEWKGDAPSPAHAEPTALLAQFAGANAPRFTAHPDTGRDGTARTVWDWTAGGNFPLIATMTVERKNGALVSASLLPDYGLSDSRQNRAVALLIAAVAVATLTWVAALILFVVWAAQHKINYRYAVLMVLLQVGLGALSFWSSPYQNYLEAKSGNSGVAVTVGSGIKVNGAPFLTALSLFLFFAAGSAVRPKAIQEKWQTLDLLWRRRILNRTVGGSLAVGMLSGLAIAPLRYLIPGGGLKLDTVDALLAPFPLADAIRFPAFVGAGLFAFLVPLSHFLHKLRWRWALLFLVGAFAAMLSMPFESPWAMLGAAALTVAACILIYWHGDLLAVIVSLIMAQGILVPCALLMQPAPSLRDSAVKIFGVFAIALAALLHLAVRGREPDAAPEAFGEEGVSLQSQSERERLEAEFAVARKAQQDVLPVRAPDIQGYSIAAACNPAYQVGGDLYDYFPLPDGRLGIAVADVSGKGVPAALYMMMTKGLLAALSEDTRELTTILDQVNGHLYRAGQRKVFVTMAAVALDAAAGRLEYGRAGHNPMMWRRHHRGETLMLKPAGLGLGMTGSDRFRRALRVEEIALEKGDAIVLYSDGITEAINPEMEQFGEGRLMQAVERVDGLTAEKSRDSILGELAAFMGDTPARDDITLVVMRVGEFAAAT